VVWACINSILSQPFSSRQRTFWIVVVIALPLVGALAYLPYSTRKDEFLILPKKSRPKPGGSSGSRR
jgi:hypothetical protein